MCFVEIFPLTTSEFLCVFVRLCMSVSVCASTKLVQNYLQDRNTLQHSRHPYSHTRTHAGIVGSEKISSWSHRICKWIFMVLVDVCVWWGWSEWKREQDRDKQTEHQRMSICGARTTVWAGKNCGKLMRNCDWPRACLCMYRCIIYTVSDWVYHEPTLISVEYRERGNTKESKSLWEDRGGRARRRGSRGLLLELKK